MKEDIHTCCLTIAGSDSGGNAGIQADLRAFHAFGVHGCTVIAALTAQNPFGVTAVENMSPVFVAAQLKAVLGVYAIAALKTGMLSTSDVIGTVAEILSEYPDIAKVVDPVMVATSGAKLICDDAIRTLREKLLPLATVMTPNIPEAEVLTGRKILTCEDMRVAAKELSECYGAAVIVKGGHAVVGVDAAEDILYTEGTWASFGAARIANPISTHGTGCSFAAALAACLARGDDLKMAAEKAKSYVHDAIRTSYYVGPNCGVLGFARRTVEEDE